MNKGKPIHVGQASLIGLKAELFKKKEQARSNKQKYSGQEYVKGSLNKDILKSASSLKASIALKNNIKEATKLLKEEEEQLAEELKRSQEALKRKSKLYEKLTNEGLDNDEDDDLNEDDCPYLVNFSQKAIEKIHEKFEGGRDEWIEYTDAFGRTRKCQKKDLPSLIKLDRDIKVVASERIETNQQTKPDVNPPKTNDIIHSEPQHSDEDIDKPELFTRTNKPDEPIHFQTVEENEIRNLGTGYYAFSQEEEQRKTQMETLKKLREQTMQQRKAKQEIKAMEKARLKERLEKIMKKKNIKRDISELVSSDEEDNIEEYTKKRKQEQELEEEKKAEEAEKVKPQPRPWDKGKIQEVRISTQRKWLEDQREDRNLEFAPPSCYYDKSTSKKIDTFLDSFRNKRH